MLQQHNLTLKTSALVYGDHKALGLHLELNPLHCPQQEQPVHKTHFASIAC